MTPSPFDIKFCGQTSLADACASAEAGATMIGVIFYPRSKRYVPFVEATLWIRNVPKTVERVAVMVDPSLEEVRAALRDELFHSVQLHGQESPEFISTLHGDGFDGRLIKAFRLSGPEAAADLARFPVSRFLLDGPDPGSGQVFDWALAATVVRSHPQARFLLAGGLTADNVADGIRAVQPHGVDVATGIEAAPGRKDAEKMRRFIEACRL